MLEHDVKWYVRSCHECQVRRMDKVHIPPVVVLPQPLFDKAYVDTFVMPKSGGYRYVTHARCSLTAYPEWQMLRAETGRAIGKFIFEHILCRWGAVGEIVTDNGSPYVLALNWLADTYGIRHIRISPYNSQSNGVVERRHLDVREALVKACEGEASRWSEVAPSVFWAERVTTHKATGHSPYYMAHGVEPLLPFDLVEATFLVPIETPVMSTMELIAHRARQLQKRAEDLARIHDRVLQARYASAKHFVERFRRTVRDFDFAPGALVLVRNSRVEKELDRKTKPRYLGPMVVVRRTYGGSYILAELDGTVSKIRYAAFRLLPYHPRSHERIAVTRLTGLTDVDLDRLLEEAIPEPDDDAFPGDLDE